MMQRREAMKRVALLMGGVLSVPTLMVFQQGCRMDDAPGINTFTESHAKLLNQIGNIIIPDTDTPGAAAADTGHFAVKLLEDCYSSESRTMVLEYLNKISKDFQKKSPEEQFSWVDNIDSIVYGNGSEEEKEENKAYRLIKELTLFGYFTSEIGASQALEYVHIPGRYEGCIDLKPGQKAWA